ncbi:hypothetical protein [Corynebacterium guangdongense]|uniref:Cytoskeletal protein RodZ n=1 Tax=Corynebacterium guangdongense TaxID=1783348 RepID=A0ABU1ZZT2_9CORY|nr:hypothetical protein [Corynebacterium guangdongense]MDR7330275.1 cytoskeletal protein RodZ [Corynebacterium guangdongense]WJZ18833.1 hypothetical protein CGUA_11485 [Corynebacterium guangdongense]
MTKRSPNRLPEKYYQRRRAAAVVVIVLVVGLLIWLLTAIGGDGETAQQDPGAGTVAAEQTTSIAAPETSTPEETTSSATPASTSATPEETEKKAPANEEEESPYPDAPESEAAKPSTAVDRSRTSCELSDLLITASSDQATYPAEAQPTFYMTVANPTAADCEIDLDEASLRFEVYDLATNERIWSDTDCFEPVESGEQTFESGSERYFEAVWSRRVSAPGQCNSRPAVPSGSYFLHAVVGDNPSPAHTFNLA